jgi:hypothetical protein
LKILITHHDFTSCQFQISFTELENTRGTVVILGIDNEFYFGQADFESLRKTESYTALGRAIPTAHHHCTLLFYYAKYLLCICK